MRAGVSPSAGCCFRFGPSAARSACASPPRTSGVSCVSPFRSPADPLVLAGALPPPKASRAVAVAQVRAFFAPSWRCSPPERPPEPRRAAAPPARRRRVGGPSSGASRLPLLQGSKTQVQARALRGGRGAGSTRVWAETAPVCPGDPATQERRALALLLAERPAAASGASPGGTGGGDQEPPSSRFPKLPPVGFRPGVGVLGRPPGGARGAEGQAPSKTAPGRVPRPGERRASSERESATRRHGSARGGRGSARRGLGAPPSPSLRPRPPSALGLARGGGRRHVPRRPQRRGCPGGNCVARRPVRQPSSQGRRPGRDPRGAFRGIKAAPPAGPRAPAPSRLHLRSPASPRGGRILIRWAPGGRILIRWPPGGGKVGGGGRGRSGAPRGFRGRAGAGAGAGGRAGQNYFSNRVNNE